MVTTTKTKPLLLLRLHLDDGTRNLAGKTVTYSGVPFVARVISWGTVNSSIPYPTGLIEVADARVEVADIDNAVRGWFDTFSPIRRLGEILFEFEPSFEGDTVVELGREQPITNPSTLIPVQNSNSEGPLSDPLFQPIFTGEILSIEYPPGRAIITMRSVLAAWLGRTIPGLITRDIFPNLPYSIEYAFAPIILGRVDSVDGSFPGPGGLEAPLRPSLREQPVNNLELDGSDPQGVINCPCINTETNDYCVARHTCYSVNAVYRKRPLDARFKLVPSSEYAIVNIPVNFYGITYTFTAIRFNTPWFDGTIIHADVTGLDERYDFSTSSIVSGQEVRNPVECLINLILIGLVDEVSVQRFNGDSFLALRDRFATNGYYCDGAITESSTMGVAVSRLNGDFLIDLTQTIYGQIQVSTYQPLDDTDQIIPFDTDLILRDSFKPLVVDRVFNRFRYRYYRQNAGLQDYLKSSQTGQWGSEYTVDNAADQLEIGRNGSNPLLETDVELFFIRDHGTAQNVVKRRVGYHTLRSYPVEFQVPLPEIVYSLSLAKPVNITHFWGVSDSGWADKTLKVYGLELDLASYRATVRAVRVVHVSDADLVFSFTSAPTPAPATKRPQLPVNVNGDMSDMAPAIDLKDSLPAAPASVELSNSGISPAYFGFSPSETSPAVTGAKVINRNIMWQQDTGVDPRNVSGYIASLAQITFLHGTLDPLGGGDERPTTLTNADAYLVMFYATDFDHWFWFTGLDIDDQPIWRGLDWDGGTISPHIYDPGIGYAACDGSSTRMSLIGGQVVDQDTPNLSEDVFLYGGVAYTGPSPTAALAPTISGNTGAAGGHLGLDVTATVTGTFSGGSPGGGSDGVHSHEPYLAEASIQDIFNDVATAIHDVGHSGTGSVSSSSEASHTHGGGTVTVAADGAHDHDGSTVDMTDYNLLITNHNHALLEDTSTEDNVLGHTHGAGDLIGSTESPDCQIISYMSGEETIDVVTCPITGWAVNITGGTTDDESNPHNHVTSGIPTTTAEFDDPLPSSLDLVIASVGNHVHTGSTYGTTGAGSSHGHTSSISTIADGISHNIISITASGDIDIVEDSDGPHSHTVTGTIDGSASGSTEAVDDHVHTGASLTVSATGKPKRMGFIYYLRT